MQFQEYNQNKLRGVCATNDDQRLFNLHISTNYIGEKNDLVTEATALVYSHALLAGCGSYTREQFLDEINKLGATIKTSAQNGIFTLSLSCLDTQSAKLKSLAITMLHKPVFLQNEIKRIKRQICNELIESEEDAKLRSIQSFENALYGSSDYRYNFATNDLIDAINKITKRQLETFHQATLRHAWIFTCTCKTSLEKDTVLFIRKTQAPFISSKEPDNDESKYFIPTAKVVTKNTVLLHSIPSKQNIEINIGAAVPFTQNDDEYYAFLFGLAVLGKWGGFSGRLMSIVREKEGLTYGIYAKTDTITRYNPGHWHITTFFSPEKVMQGIASTLREIDRIQASGITQEEFDRFTVILKTQEILLQDSVLRTMQKIHALQVSGFTYEQIKQRTERMNTVSKDEVNQALHKYLDTSRLVIAAAGPVLLKKKELLSLK
jgi:zinc protease